MNFSNKEVAMLRWLFILICGNLLACTALQKGQRNPANRLDSTVERVLEQAESLELLSLQPDFLEKDAAGFHGKKILGRVEFESRRDRSNLVQAIQKGIADSDGSSALCFIPRHGVRAKRGNQTVDLVICFQCSQIQVHFENQTSTVLTTGHAKELLNELLTAAGIPLASE
jgi:hypothetical protein